MATSHRTKQLSLRFPLPLLSQIKSQADAQQQAVSDWILALVSREFESESDAANLSPDTAKPPSVLTPELLTYINEALAPLQSQIGELRTQLGESRA